MTIEHHIHRVSQLINRNSPAIMTAAGITGTVTTAYLAAKAGYQSAVILHGQDSHEDPIEDIKEKTKQVWRLYIPPVVSGVVTITAIGFASRSYNKRTAAAVSAYTLTERAFTEYRDRVVDEIGKQKEEMLRADIASDVIRNNPPNDTSIIVSSGSVMCCELYTKRYFTSDMETLRKAQNDINAMIVGSVYVTLDEFYDHIGIPHTSHSSELGWDSDKLLELRFTTVLSEDGRPCLAFDYNYIKPI